MKNRLHPTTLIAAAIAIVITAALVRGQTPPAQTADSKAAEARRLIDVLRSNAAVFDKARACQQLAVLGNRDAVPAMAALLADEKLAGYARCGLETIADPSADDALREALKRLQGKLLAGVVNSIGVRRDAKAAGALVRLASDRTSGVTNEALAALGRIATTEAAAGVQQAMAAGPAEFRPAAADACLACAQRLLMEKKQKEAVVLYDAVRLADVPKQYRVAATYGAILARGNDGLPLLAEQLRSDDGAMFVAALGVYRRKPSGEATRALVAAMDRLPPARQTLVIGALADRPDASALTVLQKAAVSGTPEVQATAIRALGQLGDASSIPLLVKAADASKPELRHAAIRAIGQIIGAQQLPMLTSRLLAARTPEETAVVQEALRDACSRTSDRNACAARLADCMPQAPVATQCFVLELIGRVGGARALQIVAGAARGGSPELQDAATRALGNWMSVDAAGVLLDLAKTHPDNKLKTRALRGYIRLARQMDLSPERRRAMCEEAIRTAQRDEERKLAEEVLSRISTARPNPRALFDGRTLDGWEGNLQVWRVREGAIVGGSLGGNPRNEFLATTKSYKNFILSLEYKLVGTEGFVNGGVQLRSVRVKQPPNEMSGYQADIGAGFSGHLYDESRRNRNLAIPAAALIKRLEKPGDWNRYEMRCEGPRVQVILNGEKTVDFTETDPAIPVAAGLIGLQIHGGCKAEISFRNISITELP